MNQISKKDRQDSLFLPSIMVYRPPSKLSVMAMTKITRKTN